MSTSNRRNPGLEESVTARSRVFALSPTAQFAQYNIFAGRFAFSVFSCIFLWVGRKAKEMDSSELIRRLKILVITFATYLALC
jgi:hypothetical protein